ncbi:hypothetical protein [Desulfopila inferna]|uniref:hypothetical protein n=1 Tax=Desulfopila inferna TaxID=468528 RepID=UPI0019665532|nr:hypothetical protein [Desulfopila inferna]MBM9603543.1 hypothetical protein [Desulfopila inferna]
MTIVIIGQEAGELQSFIDHLRINGHEVTTVSSKDEVQLLPTLENIETVLAHERDLLLVKEIIKLFPMLNYGVISSEPSDVFHELTEGYGIFMQLPSPPGQKDADEMLSRLQHLRGFTKIVAEGGRK